MRDKLFEQKLILNHKKDTIISLKMINQEKQLRRIQIEKYTPAELAIYNAIQEVEKLPADVRLTEAVILLQQAKNKVADFVDEQQ